MGDFFPCLPCHIFALWSLSTSVCRCDAQSFPELSAPASRAFPALDVPKHCRAANPLRKTPKPFPPEGPSRALSSSVLGGVLELELCRDSRNKWQWWRFQQLCPAPLLQCRKLITDGLHANELINWFFCGFQSGFIRTGVPRAQPGCWRSWGKVQAAGNFAVICARSVVGFLTAKEADDEFHSVYLGFLELSGAVQILGTASSSPSSSSWLSYQAGQGQRAARIPALTAGIFLWLYLM